MGVTVARPVRSLKARALQLLSQREHSRIELKRKLLTHLAAAARAVDAHACADLDAAAEARAGDVEALLDWLESRRYLSPERFVESRIHLRAPRFGNLRIRQELRAHQLAPPADAAAALTRSELARARAVHSRKFPVPASNASEVARRARFLAGRGFSSDVVRRIVREAATVPGEGPDDDVENDAGMEAASAAGT